MLKVQVNCILVSDLVSAENPILLLVEQSVSAICFRPLLELC